MDIYYITHRKYRTLHYTITLVYMSRSSNSPENHAVKELEAHSEQYEMNNGPLLCTAQKPR